MSTNASEEVERPETESAARRTRLRVRVSPYTYAVVAIAAGELLCIILSLALPWGKSASGSDIKAGLAGLMPWFLFVPVLIQLGFFVVYSGVLKAIYLVTDFVLGLFVVLFHYLSYMKYGTHLRTGFFFVFAGAVLALLAGIVCAVEGRHFPKLLSAAKARVVGM